ncbi:hypothetical protein [Moorena sp. SIO3H5]|nr:hypothetical protein [Moorena sp. SIO3H5]NEO71441.1 hypothetical protein [Moorena sp. SIO3H5]
MRYTLFFTSSLLPAPCSLKPRTNVPHGYKTCYIYSATVGGDSQNN